MTLRPYQQESVSAALDFFLSNRTSAPRLSVAPTAAGKSIIIAAIASSLPGRVLVFQPSVELLKQNFEKYCMFDTNATVFSASAGQKKLGKVSYATIGSVVSVAGFFNEFNYLIIDEAHLYPPNAGSMFGKFLAANPQLKILGLTATPFRLQSSMSGSKLVMMHNSNIYKGYCHIIQIQEIAKQYWCPIKYMVDSGMGSVLKINSTGAEYTDESLALYGQQIEDKVIHYVEKCAGFSKLVFVPTIEQALALSKNTPGSAAVSSKTPKAEREAIINGFKEGKIETVFNVNLLSVGFDYPGLRIIIDAVPTMSLARYYQKIGRLTRQHASKRIAGCIDLAGNYAKFGRVEDLEIRKMGTTYHVFTGERQLTGVNFGDAFVPRNPPPSQFVDMEINFGKHRGCKISQVPTAYLSWMVDNVGHSEQLVANAKMFLTGERVTIQL